MKHLKKILFIIALFATSLTAFSGEKYAVIIAYRYIDTADMLFLAHRNDTYLMYEMLKHRGFSDEKIYVLFSDSISGLISSNSRYSIPTNMTYYPASVENITTVSGILAHCMSEEDFLFVSVMADGPNVNNNVGISLKNQRVMWDREFASLFNPLPAHRKIYWMQNTNAAGFIDNLDSENTIFLLHNSREKFVVADDEPCTENELYEGSAYWHSEFDYHLLSALTGYSPDSLNYHCDNTELFANADLNQDHYISIDEAFEWAEDHRSTNLPFQLIDNSSIAAFSSIEYPTLLYQNITTNETHRGTIGISKDIHVTSGRQLTFLPKSEIYLLNNAKIYVDANATLTIGDLVKIYGGSSNSIIVNGNIQIGDSSKFSSIDSINNFAGLYLNNNNLQTSFNNVIFYKTDFYHYGSILTITNSSFIDCTNTNSYRGDVSVFNCTFSNAVANFSNMFSSSINNSQTVTINRCLFNNPDRKNGIIINNYGHFLIINNIINKTTIQQNQNYAGISINNSGQDLSATIPNSQISNNTIKNCNIGILVYSSALQIKDNQIFDNYFGLKLTGNSNIRIFGDRHASDYTETQYIMDNQSYELFATKFSFPVQFKYNAIIDEDNLGNPSDPLIIFNSSAPSTDDVISLDVRNNYWGDNFHPSQDLNTNVGSFLYSPIWYPGSRKSLSLDAAETLFQEIMDAIENKNLSHAQSLCFTLIESYPQTQYAQAAMKQLFDLEAVVSNDYASLKNYYSTHDSIAAHATLTELADVLSNKCDIQLQNYSNAIRWYENQIIYPTSFQDSIFAVIDLEYLYLLMEENGVKTTGMLTSFVPASVNDHYQHRDDLLSLLPGENQEEQPIATYKKSQGKLYQNQPNPFEQSTKISYSVEKQSFVTIVITDVSGKVVQKISLGEKEIGMHEIQWKAPYLTPGVYYYTLFLNSTKQDTKSMIIY